MRRLDLFLLVFATSLWAEAKPAKSPQGLAMDPSVQQAKVLLMDGKRKEAAIVLRNAIQDVPQRNRTLIRDLEAKRGIIVEQFMTAENFQKFQDIKAYADAELWPECLKGTNQVTAPDQDNLLVLRLKALCQIKSGLSEEASKTMFEILQLEPTDPPALVGLAMVALERKQFTEGLKVLEPLVKAPPKQSEDLERLVIVKSRLLEEIGNFDEAVDLLVGDQQSNLNHVEVIYRLGQLYQRHPGYDWQARRSYSLFVSRCKRLPGAELTKRHLEGALAEAQGSLVALDKKLVIESGKSSAGR